MFLISDGPLESQEFKVVNNSSVNPVQANITPELVNGALYVYLSSIQPYGGALVYTARPVPFAGSLFVTSVPLVYVGLDWDIVIPAPAAKYMRCLEIDLKAALFPALGKNVNNLIDGSSQIEIYNNGNLQIVNEAGSWVDTGFHTGSLPVDVPFHWSARWVIDTQNDTYSVLSFTIAGITYTIPSNLQNLPWRSSNWAQTANVQLQLDNNTQPSAFCVKYSNGYLRWADTSF